MIVKNILYGLLSIILHVIIFLLYFFLPIVVANFINTPSSAYFALTIILISGGVHFFYYLYFKDSLNESKSKSLFDWLDNKNDKNIVREIMGKELNKDEKILTNLEVTQKRLLTYVKYNKNKLLLIKALLKTMNNNYLSDLIFRLFIPIIATIIIGSISNPLFRKVTSVENSDISSLNPEILSAIGNIFLLCFILVAIALFIFEKHKGRRRNKLFEELIETCIQKIEDENKTKI
ncbi:hypothetical protein SB775_25795 [Peribacillus sp. SIMBA_075]|uniref:hypothetical protein n=1 Tax=Peribacillus sp. SIMBA_075 TaxID=3085813 RepID=UPI00397BB738